MYLVGIWNGCAAIESLAERLNINNAWESNRANIKNLAKVNIGYDNLKLNIIYFVDECSNLMD
jgi:hypothetical protein